MAINITRAIITSDNNNEIVIIEAFVGRIKRGEQVSDYSI